MLTVIAGIYLGSKKLTFYSHSDSVRKFILLLLSYVERLELFEITQLLNHFTRGRRS